MSQIWGKFNGNQFTTFCIHMMTNKLTNGCKLSLEFPDMIPEDNMLRLKERVCHLSIAKNTGFLVMLQYVQYEACQLS